MGSVQVQLSVTFSCGQVLLDTGTSWGLRRQGDAKTVLYSSALAFGEGCVRTTQEGQPSSQQ
jgi:hypothetical protein